MEYLREIIPKQSSTLLSKISQVTETVTELKFELDNLNKDFKPQVEYSARRGTSNLDDFNSSFNEVFVKLEEVKLEGKNLLNKILEDQYSQEEEFEDVLNSAVEYAVEIGSVMMDGEVNLSNLPADFVEIKKDTANRLQQSILKLIKDEPGFEMELINCYKKESKNAILQLLNSYYLCKTY